MSAISNNVKKIRKEKGMTQFELAESVGISRSYLNDIENNRHNPSIKTVGSLAQKLNVQVGDLIADEVQELSVTTRIEKWAIERNLHTADPMKQALKLGEEYGELCQGLAKGRFEDTKDAIGDMIVVLTIMAMQLETTVEDCTEMAYNEIKDRKGKMVNGVFVKESDLHGRDGNGY